MSVKPNFIPENAGQEIMDKLKIIFAKANDTLFGTNLKRKMQMPNLPEFGNESQYRIVKDLVVEYNEEVMEGHFIERERNRWAGLKKYLNNFVN